MNLSERSVDKELFSGVLTEENTYFYNKINQNLDLYIILN